MQSFGPGPVRGSAIKDQVESAGASWALRCLVPFTEDNMSQSEAQNLPTLTDMEPDGSLIRRTRKATLFPSHRVAPLSPNSHLAHRLWKSLTWDRRAAVSPSSQCPPPWMFRTLGLPGCPSGCLYPAHFQKQNMRKIQESKR